MLKVSYIDYLKVLKSVPTFTDLRKLVRGDEVLVPLEIEKKAREVLGLPEEVAEPETPVEVCEKCLKIKARCICEKLAEKAAREAAISKSPENESNSVKTTRNAKGQKEGPEATIDPLVAQMMKLRVEMKAQGKSKAEIKSAIEALQKK